MQRQESKLFDDASVYGWISILLHWVTAIAIIALWFLGKSIFASSTLEIDAQRSLHVSIAASVWLIVLARIIWRVRSGHPHVRGQTLLIHRIAKTAHYAMLIALLLMLVSGPVMVWAGGYPVGVFSLFAIPGPIPESESLRNFAWYVHSNSALLLLVLVILHIGGALKHLMFHTDDTFARMIWPGKQENNE